MPWQAAFRTTQVLGGHPEFVLSSSGHIQSIVNPTGNPKAPKTLGNRKRVVNGRILAALIPGAQLRVMRGSGHLFLVDEADESAQLIRKFLASSGASGVRGPD